MRSAAEMTELGPSEFRSADHSPFTKSRNLKTSNGAQLETFRHNGLESVVERLPGGKI